LVIIVRERLTLSLFAVRFSSPASCSYRAKP
jgi:hypothetical protein